MTIRFGILGAGRIGQVHAAAIAATPGATVTAVADAHAEAAENIASAYNCETSSIDEIAANDSIEAVAICTPTDMHADQIEQFARAGKAIFCEKPIDLDVARVQTCLQTVKDTGAPLMIGFNRRFDADFGALHKSIRDGRIGDVESVIITSRDPGPPPISYIERSGGIFRDMTIHDFDIARWMLGEEVETVFAQGSVLVDPEIGTAGDYDSAHVLLKTASGKQSVISNSRRASYGYDQRIEVHGSKGMASAGNAHEARVEVATTDGYTRPPLLDFFMQRYEGAYRAEIRAFVEAIQQKQTPPATGHDGLMALVLAEAANRSVAEGRLIAVAEVL
ncbi:MAG: inositol 2-dehydrogenase [Pseudomonadota bacterium]